ncbi:family S53 protease-like protein [Roridomyces roridus]|uniref:tripeptidyl-peptidase II n=1 Tax=Roridomyces roridus TaxID=1738132 RepID=A0AAD7C1F8_9AGAR|nr:family S53 protease-like protein [Roridomyces roridus]
MVFLALFVAALCNTGLGGTVVHERRATAPRGFVNHGPAHPTQMLTLRLGLAPNNAAGLDATLASISTPGSPEFRQWLSREEVKSYLEPSAETLSALESFASANGLEYQITAPNGDWATITLPVSHADQLFDAEFTVFSHRSTSENIARTLSVSLPAHLVGHVEVIHPTTDFTDHIKGRLMPGPVPLKRQADASCDTSTAAGVITPTCLQALYGIPAAPATQSSSHLLVAAYQGVHAQIADISEFLTQFRPDIPANTTYNVLTTSGGSDPQGPTPISFEANLDMEYTMGIATNVSVDFLSVGNPIASLATSFLDTTTFIAGLDNPPTVMTTSWGGNEDSFDLSMATRICDGYKALGARGISVIFASGDGGVHGGHDSASVCETPFIPVFPASCPWVTSVGATFGWEEKALNLSSGGFSNYFSTPDYQTTAVSNFLQTGIPQNFTGVFNASGRGFPDVAVQGWDFAILDGGLTTPSLGSGTSASSPLFAAIIALVNDRLVAAGKPVLGFLNPFLYSVAQERGAFTDVTEGRNTGYECPAGGLAFDAGVGWDPLSGWGSPKFEELLAAAVDY